MALKYNADNPEGIYFVSCATTGWLDFFIRAEYKDIFAQNLNYCIEKKGLIVYAWVLMTSHFHLICSSDLGKEKNVISIIGDFKKYTSRIFHQILIDKYDESRKDWLSTIYGMAGTDNPRNKDFQFWQHDNHPIELYSRNFIEQKLTYIHNNPVVEATVEYPEHYLYSSARDYNGKQGLIKITLII